MIWWIKKGLQEYITLTCFSDAISYTYRRLAPLPVGLRTR